MAAHSSAPVNRRWALRRPRYGLRFLFLLVLIVAVWMAWARSRLAHQEQREQALAALAKAEAVVVSRPAPSWIRSCLGLATERALDDVVAVKLVDQAFGPRAPLRDFDLRSISCLTELERLTLRLEQPHAQGVATLSGFTSLRELDVSGSVFDDQCCQYIAGARNLTNLNLAGTKITGDGLKWIASLANLETLDLTETDIDDAGLAYLARLSNLRVLKLRETKISTRGIQCLAGLKKLERLDLCATQVDDGMLASLQHLPQLVELDVSGTRVFDVRPLASYPSLRIVHVSGDRIDDSSADALPFLAPRLAIISGGIDGRVVYSALGWIGREQSSDAPRREPGRASEVALLPDAYVSALSLLAHMGAGYYYPSKRPAPTQAICKLLSLQSEDGTFCTEGPIRTRVDVQAIATLTLCELYRATEHEHLRKPILQAADALQSQWLSVDLENRRPTEDIPRVGWSMLAIASLYCAEMRSLPDAATRIEKLLDAWDSGELPSGRIQSRLTQEAEFLLCRALLRNLPKEEIHESVLRCIDKHRCLPWAEQEPEAWFFLSFLNHQCEEKPIPDLLHDEFIPRQRSCGRYRFGSWDPPDPTLANSKAERFRTTCFITLATEVYYRHLPMYRSTIYDSDPDLDIWDRWIHRREFGW